MYSYNLQEKKDGYYNIDVYRIDRRGEEHFYGTFITEEDIQGIDNWSNNDWRNFINNYCEICYDYN